MPGLGVRFLWSLRGGVRGGEWLDLGMMYGEKRWGLVGEGSSGERGEDKDELREEGIELAVEDVLRAAARRAGL